MTGAVPTVANRGTNNRAISSLANRTRAMGNSESSSRVAISNRSSNARWAALPLQP
jgi:hypothetical protein